MPGQSLRIALAVGGLTMGVLTAAATPTALAGQIESCSSDIFNGDRNDQFFGCTDSYITVRGRFFNSVDGIMSLSSSNLEMKSSFVVTRFNNEGLLRLFNSSQLDISHGTLFDLLGLDDDLTDTPRLEVTASVVNNNGTFIMDAPDARISLHDGATFNNLAYFQVGGILANEPGGSIAINDNSTFYNYGQIIINEAFTLPESGFFTEGMIENNSVLTSRSAFQVNTGEIINGSDAEFRNEGGFFDAGQFDNAGTVINTSGGYFHTDGIFSNSGNLENDGSFLASREMTSTGTVRNDGSFDNTGTLTSEGLIENGGTFTNSARLDNRGTVDNSGFFENTGQINGSGGSIGNRGTMHNAGVISGGLITNLDGGAFLNTGDIVFNEATPGSINIRGGRLENRGTIIGPRGGFIDNRFGGRLENYGRIELDAYVFSASATTTLEAGGTFQTSRLLQNEVGNTQLNQGDLLAGGVFENKGTLTNSGTLAAEGDSFVNHGTVNNIGVVVNTVVDGRNTGTIDNAGTFENRGPLENAGTLTNQDGGLLRNTGTVTNTGHLTLAGTLDNTGGIITNEDGGVINVATTLTLGDASAGTFDLKQGGTVHVTGVLTNAAGHRQGNGGTITTAEFGGLHNEGTFDNAGTVNSSFSLNADGAVWNNTGALTVTDSPSNPSSFVNLGIVNNAAGSVITVDEGAGFSNARGGALHNDGTIINNGEFRRQAGATETNTGRFINNGKFSNFSGTAALGGTFTSTGIVTNAGTLSISGTFSSELGSTLDNTGTVENTGQLTLAGTLDNTGGVITNEDGGLIEVATTLTLGDASAGTFDLKQGGTVNVIDSLINAAGHRQGNGGTITTAEFGALLNEGTFDNAGTVNSSFSLNADGAVWNNTGALTVTNSPSNPSSFVNLGTVNNEESSVITVDEGAGFSNARGGALHNDGTIINNGEFRRQAGATETNTGRFINNGEFSNFSGTATLGGTFVNQGVVNAGSGITFTGDVAGSGSYTGNVTFDGTFRPGNSPALVAAETLAFGASSALFMEIGGYGRGSEYDAIDAMSVTLDGLLTVALLDLGDSFSPLAGDTFDLIVADQIFGNFASFEFATLATGLAWTTNLFSNQFGQMVYQLVVQAQEASVPTPGTLILLIAGCAGIAFSRRRKTA